MAQTVISGKQVKDATIQRVDLDTNTVGQAVVTKIVQGNGITLSSTGADSGTGDVTIAAATGVSANANNKATLGSDSLILVQGTAAGVAATTHAQTVSGDDPQLTNARTPTAHQATHNGGADPIPLASAAAQGLCPPVDNTTIKVVGGKLVASGGGGSSSPVVLGETATDASFPNGIVVPRFANHPDAIWSYGTFDDHFDGSSLNAKWTSGGSRPLSNLVNRVASSKFSLGGNSPSNSDLLNYANYIYQTLPNGNAFTVSLRVDLTLVTDFFSASQGAVTFRLYNGTTNVGLDSQFIVAYSATYGVVLNLVNFYGSTAIGTLINQVGAGKPPSYIQLVWTPANATVTLNVSDDGNSWMWLNSFTSAQTGFTAANPPLNFWLMPFAINQGRTLLQIDWIKFTNP